MRPVSTDANQDPRALIEAIKKYKSEIENVENLEDVKKLLSNGYDFDKWHHKDEESGDSLLHIAVKSGNNEILKLLLEKGLNPLVVDNDNNNPLHLSAKNNNLDMVATLLPYHPFINRPGQYGNTALHFASENNNTKLVTLLLEKGAELEALNNSKNTPLHLAAGNNDPEAYNLLVDKKAKSNAVNNMGKTPMDIANFSGNNLYPTNTYLAKGGTRGPGGGGASRRVTSSNTSSNTSLHSLATNDSLYNLQQVKNIIESGGYVDKNLNGNTPLHYACTYGSARIAEVLINAGANVKAPNGSGETPLHLGARNGNPDIATLLLSNGADPLAVEDTNQWPAIQLSVLDDDEFKNLMYLRALLRNGANPNQLDKDNCTALMQASHDNSAGAVRVLLQGGAIIDSVTKDSYGEYPEYSALHIGADRGRNEAIQVLLEEGASIDKVTKNGETAIMIAKRRNNTETVKLLYENGATTNDEDIFQKLGNPKKRDEELLKKYKKLILEGDPIALSSPFITKIKLEAIKSIELEEIDGDPKINSSYRKLIELNEIGVKTEDTDNSDKMIKAILRYPAEFDKLFETSSQLKMLSCGEDGRLSVNGEGSDDEKNSILAKIHEALDPSLTTVLNKNLLKDGGSKLENNLSAKFKTALGASASALINNLIGEVIFINELSEAPAPAPDSAPGLASAPDFFSDEIPPLPYSYFSTDDIQLPFPASGEEDIPMATLLKEKTGFLIKMHESKIESEDRADPINQRPDPINPHVSPNNRLVLSAKKPSAIPLASGFSYLPHLPR